MAYIYKMGRNILQNNHFIYYITCIYFGVLLFILAFYNYTPTNDGDGYIEFAKVCINSNQAYPCMALIQGQPFIWNIGSINLVYLSLILFNSLYPLLILLCLLKAFTALLIGKITQKLFNTQIANISIILYVFYPNNLGQSTTILSEIPMICMALAALYIAITQEKIWCFLISGIIFGLANWFRPIGIVFLGTIILYIIFFQKTNKTKKITSLCCGYILFIATVGIECYHRTGYFLYQAESLWFNMAEATYEPSVAPQYGTDPYPKGTIRYIDKMQEKTAIECNEIWRERSLKWLKRHPLEYLGKIPGRLIYMYYNDMDNLSAFLSNKKNAENNYITLPYRNIIKDFFHLSRIQYFALYNWIYYLIILILSFLGTFILLKYREYGKAFIPLMIIIGGSISLVLAIHGETRFKAPFMPFIFILAAVTITHYMNKNKIKQL